MQYSPTLISTFFLEHYQNDLNQSHLIGFRKIVQLRVGILIYLTIALIDNNIQVADYGSSFIYLTKWGAFIEYIKLFFHFKRTQVLFLINLERQFYHDKLWQSAHILFTVGFCFQILIFLMFWGVVFPEYDIVKTRDWILQINLHGGFFFCILLDQIFNDIKILKSHFLILFVALGFYLAFNVTYVLSYGVEIYPNISWQNAQSYIVLVVGAALELIVFTSLRQYYQRVKFDRIELKTGLMLGKAAEKF